MSDEVVGIGLGLDASVLDGDARKVVSDLQQRLGAMNQRIEQAAQKSTQAQAQSFNAMARTGQSSMGKLATAVGSVSGVVGGLDTKVGKMAQAFSGLAGLVPSLLNPLTLVLTASVAVGSAIVSNINETNKRLDEQAARTRAAREEWDEFYKSVVGGQTAAQQQMAKFDEAFQNEVIRPLAEERARVVSDIERLRGVLAAPEFLKMDKDAARQKLDARIAEERALTAAILKETRARAIQVQDVEWVQGGRQAPGDPRSGTSGGNSDLDALRERGRQKRQEAEERAAREAAARRLKMREIEAREEVRLQTQIDQQMFGMQEHARLATEAAWAQHEERRKAQAEASIQAERREYEIRRQIYQKHMEETAAENRKHWSEAYNEQNDFMVRLRQIGENQAQVIGDLTMVTIQGIGQMISGLMNALGSLIGGVNMSVGEIFGGFLSMLGSVMIAIGSLMLASSLVTFGVSAGPGAAILGLGMLLSLAGGAISAGSKPATPTKKESAAKFGGGRRSPTSSGFMDRGGGGDVPAAAVTNIYVNRPLATSGEIARDYAAIGVSGDHVWIGGGP